MLNKTLISTGSEVEIAHNTLALKELKSDIQKRLRVMKNVWWESKAHELQKASDRKDSKKVYNLLKQVYGPTKSSFCSISSKDGSQSFRQPDEIRKRWCEHYELLNHFAFMLTLLNILCSARCNIATVYITVVCYLIVCVFTSK